MVTRRALLKIRGFSEVKVEKIKDAAAKLIPQSFLTGTHHLLRRQLVIRITTGAKELDRVLGGGVQTQSITEVFGEFRTGKTQLAHTLCVTAQLPRDMNGGSGMVAVIDTEGTFRPERIRDIAIRFGADPEQVLENMIIARAFNSEHQYDLVNEVAIRFAERPNQFRLLIIDSIIALLRTDYSGRGELAERQQKLNQLMARLIKISEEFNIAVFITNQISADPAGGMTFVADPKKPVGGHVLAHASTTRLSLRKGRGEQRIAKIYDSPDMPEAEAVYALSEGGVVDASD